MPISPRAPSQHALLLGGAVGLTLGCGSSSDDDASSRQAPAWGIEARPVGQTCVPPTTQSSQPTLLSATGCVDAADPKKPAATLIPYAVATPLWSDSAQKQRFFALPDGATIHVKDCTSGSAPDCQDPLRGGGTYEDEGDWDFPDGSVLMKTFALEGKVIETRLLMKKDANDWWGYSYHWNDAQTDAELWDANTDGNDQMVSGPDGSQDWHFPSRGQCLQCHTTAAGVSLGLETSQLDFDFTYPNGVTANQLSTLEHVGVFDAPPPARPAYPTPSDTAATLDERARSYLHVNCGICHRPGGNFTDFDARFATAFADTRLCGTAPDKLLPNPPYTLPAPLRIDPGHPENSVVSLRMHSLSPSENIRMPQIGSLKLDDAGTKLIDDWITALTGCP